MPKPAWPSCGSSRASTPAPSGTCAARRFSPTTPPGRSSRLALLGAEALVEALPRVAAGEAPIPQAEVGVSHAPKVDRTAARIEWNAPAEAVANQIRAMDPTPGAWTTLAGQSIKLFGSQVAPSQALSSSPPGTLHLLPEGLAVSCADGLLVLADVQPAGKPRMAARTWANGLDPAQGMRFE